MSETFVKVRITDIDSDDKLFRVSLTPKDTRALAESIKNTGLIAPPLLRPADNDGYIIVSGISRIQALIMNHDTEVQAVVLPSHTSDLECAMKAISSEAFQRPLSQAEIVLGIKILSAFTDIENISTISKAVFNTHFSPTFVKDMEKISRLPNPALELLQAGQLSVKSARRLTEFSETVQKRFISLFSELKASSSKQLEIITHMFEISARDKTGLVQVFSNPFISTLVADEQKPPGVKADTLRTYLYEMRYPSLSETRKKVQQHLANLKLGPGIKFSLPENFESTRYTVSITAETPREFETCISKISRAAGQDDFKQIFIS